MTDEQKHSHLYNLALVQRKEWKEGRIGVSQAIKNMDYYKEMAAGLGEWAEETICSIDNLINLLNEEWRTDGLDC